MRNISEKYILLIRILERLLAVIVFGGVIFMTFSSFEVMLNMDWSQTETFYELIYRVLLAVIGLELIRMLITHEMIAVLELLAFVIARKMLKPDLTSVDIFLSVVAFVALVLVHQIITEKDIGEKIVDKFS